MPKEPHPFYGPEVRLEDAEPVINIEEVEETDDEKPLPPSIFAPARTFKGAFPKLVLLYSPLAPAAAASQDLALASVSAVAVDVADSNVLLKPNADVMLPIASMPS